MLAYGTIGDSRAQLFATRYSNSTCLRTLLDAGTEPLTADIEKHSALHGTVWQPDGRDLVKLQAIAGVPVHRQTMFGSMPLALAALSNKPVVAEALLVYGVNINASYRHGDNALHLSLRFQADDVTRLLIARGIEYVLRNSDGDSTLHLAAISGGLQTLKTLQIAALKHIDPDALRSRTLTHAGRTRATQGTPRVC